MKRKNPDKFNLMGWGGAALVILGFWWWDNNKQKTAQTQFTPTQLK